MPARRPSATLVLLVRHAVTPTTGVILPGRAPGLHLSAQGRAQAAATARRIAGLRRVAAVYASPLERARETAAAIGRARRLPVQTERGLIELDTGEWTGRSLARLRRKREWPVVVGYPSGFRFPGGESFVEMQARVAAALGRLVERHRGQAVVAVSHADPIKAAVAHALGLPLDLFQRLVIAPASVTAVVYRPQGPTVLTVNAVDGDLTGLLPR
jgi:probable phosphomutase (TIGR03848 family)